MSLSRRQRGWSTWALLLLVAGGRIGLAQEIVGPPWITSGPPPGNERLAAIRPEVQSVRKVGDQLEIRSAGLSLHYFGPLQNPATPVERLRRHRFQLPIKPTLNDGEPVPVRPDVVGLFVNGVPIYQQVGPLSYRGQNIWHFDLLALNDDGRLVSTGRPRAELTHAAAPGLLDPLIRGNGGHSPIIGFALDGYPIYGPWGYVPAEGSGAVRRLRSGYRLRPLVDRDQLPDGTNLPPGQHGPAVSAEFPLGSFVEDYAYAPAPGDLDRFNGRWTVTPEYPTGTYAYFLTTDPAGRLAFPYLLASHYRGALSPQQMVDAWRDEAAGPPPAEAIANQREIEPVTPQPGFRLLLRTQLLASARTTRRLRLSFEARSPTTGAIRHLPYVHERPLHLLVVAEDLGEFHHLHPELVAGDRYEVEHLFEAGQRYRLYADYTPPGGSQQIIAYRIEADGEGRRRPSRLPTRASAIEQRREGLTAHFAPAVGAAPRAGAEVEFRLRVRNEAGELVEGLEPFLGAWAHFVAIDPAHRHFIHAHPLGADSPGPVERTVIESLPHAHLPADPGPPPDEIRTMIIFPTSGLYRVWAQFQVDGRLITIPFDLQVGPPVARGKRSTPNQLDAAMTRVRVSSRGFSPAEVVVPSGQPWRIAIERASEPNCASQIVIPSLGIRKELPLGETTILHLPPLKDGRLSFSCGMGMYNGLFLISPAPPAKKEPTQPSP